MGRGVAVKDVKVGKGESCSEGGFRRCHHLCPMENFNHTMTIIFPSRCNSHAMTGSWTINDA